MAYKITSIYADQVKKVTTGAKPDIDSILTTPTVNTDHSHTDHYYLIVSVSFEYDGKRGRASSTVQDTTNEILTVNYGSDGLVSSISNPSIPSQSTILTQARTRIEEYLESLDKEDYIRSTVEEIRQTVGLYKFPSEDLKPGVGV